MDLKNNSTIPTDGKIESKPPLEKKLSNGAVSSTTSNATNSNSTNAATPKTFNSRLLWPDIIKTPENSWTFTCKEIIDRLGTDPHSAADTKKNMENCLMYFYTLKKKLNLFDHSYTAACILFFRYWYVYGLPPVYVDCIHMSQAILVSACKVMENNRPIDMYVKATAEFLSHSSNNRMQKNIDKLKWDVRDKLVTNEKKFMCLFGFDLNFENPKEIIEEIFSAYYRYNRDFDLPDEFTKVFPKILQQVRSFIVQAVTQPVSLLCDGYSFIALALIYCGLQYKNQVDKDFKFPKNFFKERFPISVTSKKMNELFTDYRILEDNFFNLKSNKGDKLQISVDDIDGIIDEANGTEAERVADPYDYDLIKSGEVKQELLDHIEVRVRELFEKTIAENKKRHKTGDESHSEPPEKKIKV